MDRIADAIDQVIITIQAQLDAQESSRNKTLGVMTPERWDAINEGQCDALAWVIDVLKGVRNGQDS